MKILLVGYTIPASGVRGMGLGISRYIYHLGKELRKMGHETDLVVRNDFKPEESWVKTVRAPKFSWYPYPFFLKGYLKDKEADVFNSDYVLTGAPLAWLNKKPLVITIHDAIPFHSGYGRDSIKSRLFVKFFKMNFNTVKKKADAIVVRSKNARLDLLHSTNVDENKIFVVSGGVDMEFFHPIKNETHNKIRIGYKGGLDGRKNVELLVEVFKKMVKKRKDIELHVAGTGSNLEKFRSMRIPNAKFYGFIPIEKENDFLNSLDIYTYPTLAEGLGQGPLEAMACKIPVLSSNVTSMSEVVGGAGVITEPTIEPFYKELWKLVESKTLRNKLARSCLKRAKLMTWKRTAEDSLKIYETIR